MFLGNVFGSDGLIFLIIALVVVFGGSQLPKIARNVGSAGKEFRKAQAEAEEEESRKAQADSVAPQAVTAAPVQPQPQVVPVVATPAAPVTPVQPSNADGEKVTLSKAELDALLDERMKRGQSAN